MVAKNSDILKELKVVSKNLRTGLTYVDSDNKDNFKDVNNRFNSFDRNFKAFFDKNSQQNDLLKEQLEIGNKNTIGLINKLSSSRTSDLLEKLNSKQDKVYKENQNLVNNLINFNKNNQTYNNNLTKLNNKSIDLSKNLLKETRQTNVIQSSNFINLNKNLKSNNNDNKELLNDLINLDSKHLEVSELNQKTSKILLDKVKASMTDEKMNTTLANLNSSIESGINKDEKLIGFLKDKKNKKDSDSKFQLGGIGSGLSDVLNGLGSILGIGGLAGLLPLVVKATKGLSEFTRTLPEQAGKLLSSLKNVFSSAFNDIVSFFKFGKDKAVNLLGKSVEGGKALLTGIGGKVSGITTKVLTGASVLAGKSADLMKLGFKGTGKLLGPLSLGLTANDMANGFNNTNKILGLSEDTPASNMQILQSGALNAATLGGFLTTPENLQKKIEGGFDSFFQPSSIPDNATSSPKAFKLARISENRNVLGKYSGNVQNILKGAGRCYANVWGNIVNAGLSNEINPVGGTHNQLYATDFSEWAETAKGQAVLNKVGMNPKSKNLGLLPGDIIVFQKGWYEGNEAGHIEIVGTDGSGYSDFKDTNLNLVKSNLNKIQGIYRLKDNSSYVANKPKNINQNKTPETKIAVKPNNNLKTSDLIEHEYGSNFKAGSNEKTASITQKSSSIKTSVTPVQKKLMDKRAKQVKNMVKIPSQKIQTFANIPTKRTKGNEINFRDDRFLIPLNELKNNTEIISQNSTTSNLLNNILENKEKNEVGPMNDFLNSLPTKFNAIDNFLNNTPILSDVYKNFVDSNQNFSGIKDVVGNVVNMIPNLTNIVKNPLDTVKNILPQLTSFLPENLSDIGNIANSIMSYIPSDLTKIDFSSFIPSSINDLVGAFSNPNEINPIQKVSGMAKDLLLQSPFLNQEQKQNNSSSPVIALQNQSPPRANKSTSVEDYHLAIITSGLLD